MLLPDLTKSKFLTVVFIVCGCLGAGISVVENDISEVLAWSSVITLAVSRFLNLIDKN